MVNIWNVILFGGLEAAWNLQPIRFATRKTASLFAFLAYHRGKSFPRDTIAEKFWPENDMEAARNSLRVALSHLRKQIEPGGISPGSILLTNRSTVCLAAESISTDVILFHNALAQEAGTSDVESKIQYLLRAAELYRGPLLQGWYDEWIYPEQTHLTEIYTAALGRLSDYMLATGDMERALEFARRGVQAEPLWEANHQRLIEVYAVMGRQEAALQQYRELERLFRRELDVEPARSTRELVARIQRDREHIAETPSGTTIASAASVKPTATCPQWFTSFYGHEVELQLLQDTLRERHPGENRGRLVTLVGPGGIGKSRLVVEATTRLWQAQFPGRIFMVELAEISSYDQLPSTVVAALGLNIPEDCNPMDVLSTALAAAPCLLILDGVDPLMEGAISAIHALRTALPGIPLIVTARQPLGLSGERIISVPPLLVPPPRVLIAPDKLMGWPSIQLFVDRDRAVRPDFKLTPENAGAIAALNSRLDGLPLAIELAAAWVNLLAPDEILKRLEARFDLLVSQNQAVPQRHRSLRAVMDETCRLLPEKVAQFFACLSVFRGGWTFEAAQSLCTQSPVLEYLSILQQRSLVISTETGDSVRFRMIETVREYARSLISSKEYQKHQRDHALYYAELAERLGPKANCPNAGSDLTHLEAEQENLRSAIHRCLGALEEPLVALRLGAALWRLWYSRGLAEAGIHALTAALERTGDVASADIRVAALEGAGRLALCLGQSTRACGLFREGLEMATRDRNATPEKATILASNLAVAAKASGDPATTREAFQMLLALKTQEQDPWGMAYALAEIAKASNAMQEPEVARTHTEAGRKLLERLGETPEDFSRQEPLYEERVAQALLRVGFLASEQGDHTTAIPLLEDALKTFRRARNPFSTAIALERLGLAAFRCKDWSKARDVLEEALALRREGIGANSTAFTLGLLTQIARHTHDTFALKHLRFSETGPVNGAEHVK